MVKKFHGKTENMGRKRSSELVIKTIKVHPDMIAKVEKEGAGNFSGGLKKILKVYFGLIH